jgi:outer membrane immunogenic protein
MRLLVASALATVMVAGAAQAADLPTKAPVYKAPVAAQFSWAGFYIGGNVGYGWGKKEWSDFFDPVNHDTVRGADAHYHTKGFLGGGQVGYNWQSGWTVYGVEADASWSNIKGNAKNSPIDPGNCLEQDGGCETKIEAFGTIAARLGVAVERSLLYVKGGAAWVHEKHTTGHLADTTRPEDIYSGTTSETRWGWTIGGGVEYAFAPNWSTKIEYNYLNFGKDQVSFTFTPAQTFGAGGTLQQTMHVVKFGLNYRLGGY